VGGQQIMNISEGDKVLITEGGTYQEGGGEYEVMKGSTATVLEAYEPLKYKVYGYGLGFRVFRVRLDSIPPLLDESYVKPERETISFKVGDVIEIDIEHIQLIE
jgi:hypothetical protein